MLKKIMATLMALLFAAASFAAVEANKVSGQSAHLDAQPDGVQLAGRQ